MMAARRKSMAASTTARRNDMGNEELFNDGGGMKGLYHMTRSTAA
jgi:hypothetical protein